MDRNIVWNKISQLPMALFGITHAFLNSGISLSIFKNSIFKIHCEMPLLP